MKILVYFILCLINIITAYELHKLSPFTILWRMDNPNRMKFGRRYEIKNLENGMSQLSHIEKNIPPNIIPSNSLNDAYVRLCNDFDNTDLKKEFLQNLNESLIFQKAGELYENRENYFVEFIEDDGQKSFIDKVGELLFSEEEPQFYSLFCQFTQEKGNWHSFIREQPHMKIISLKLINNNDEIKDMQVKFIENGRMRKRRILIGTSLDFEIVVFSLCALSIKDKEEWKHCSAPIDGGYHFDMALRMSENYGHLNIASFTKILKKKKRKHKSDPEFQKLVEELWEKDVDRVDESAITLNWQGKLEKKQVKDISPDPLFSSVDESIFQKPIYAALLEMYKENNFYQQVCEQEPPMNEERREKFVKIWGLITDSEVFKLGYDFLLNHGKTDKNFDEFREHMFDFWFGTYSRCEQHENSEPLGSSGFEHVFSGEWKHGTGVEGHHNWLRYYLGEKAGEINYYGYFEHQNNNILGTFQYKWKGFLKRIGGFFFRTSPAFDFTLFTVCSLTQPGNEACHFELLNTKMFVTSFKMKCNNGTCLATSYPGLY
ncbi:unnamed protein product [Meloidogyne enterolobii]|uniref:Uncharacterized protein n=1 Tax=Meloidogyne enterolobii TaxID=390850 RepID=A0ACB0Y7I4_MELEN